MSTLSVVVFRNGKSQRNARVRLDGPGGTREKTTNVVGSVTFGALTQGKYIVNAAHADAYLGAGYVNIRGGASGVIHIHHPIPNPAHSYGGLRVNASASGKPVSSAWIRVDGPGGQFSRHLTDSSHHTFPRLQPGDYYVQVSVTFEAGESREGAATIKVRAGSTARVTVDVVLPSPTPPPRPHRANLDFYDLVDEIKSLHKDLNVLKARLDRLQSAQRIDHGQFIGSTQKPHAGGHQDGEAGFGVGKLAADRNRHSQIQNTLDEIGSLEHKKSLLEEAVDYQMKYD